MMRNVMWLFIIVASACAATQQQDHPLAQVPSVPDPLPELSPNQARKLRAWSGFVLIGTDGDGLQAVALSVGDDGIISQATLAGGEKLPRQAHEMGWRFPVPGSIIFQAVMVSADGHHVVGVMDLGANDPRWTGTEVVVDAYLQSNDGMRLCAHGLCGELYKLVVNKPIACKGPRCADLFPPRAPRGNAL